MVNSSFLYLFTPVLNRALPEDGIKKKEKEYIFFPLSANHNLSQLLLLLTPALRAQDGPFRVNTTSDQYKTHCDKGNAEIFLAPGPFLWYQDPRTFPFSYFS